MPFSNLSKGRKSQLCTELSEFLHQKANGEILQFLMWFLMHSRVGKAVFNTIQQQISGLYIQLWKRQNFVFLNGLNLGKFQAILHSGSILYDILPEKERILLLQSYLKVIPAHELRMNGWFISKGQTDHAKKMLRLHDYEVKYPKSPSVPESKKSFFLFSLPIAHFPHFINNCRYKQKRFFFLWVVAQKEFIGELRIIKKSLKKEPHCSIKWRWFTIPLIQADHW